MRAGIVAALIAASVALPAGAVTLDDGLGRYAPYAVAQIDGAKTGAERLVERLAASDVAGARQAWVEARIGWERAETFIGSLYAELDEAIDAWPDATSGFHAIEAKLFAGEIAELQPMAEALRDRLRILSGEIRRKGVTAQGLLDGTTQLVFEMGEKKGDGGESAASGTSLDDLRHNFEGIEAAWSMVFAPVLHTRDAKLADNTAEQMALLRALLQASDLKALDQEKAGKLTERIAVSLQAAAPKIGLHTPDLGD